MPATTETEYGVSIAPPITNISLAGFGAVGQALARHILSMDGYKLRAVSARDVGKARKNLISMGADDVDVLQIDDLARVSDIVVECAPSALFKHLAKPVLEAGKTVIVLSSGALLDHWDLVELAAANGGTILVPSGALLGLDAVQAAAQGTVSSVHMTSRKPPAALVGAPYLADNGIAIENIDKPTLVFEGTAREACSGFPANLNVAVALSLSGLGPDKTTLSLWADPSLQYNTHHIEVASDSAIFSMDIQNIPSFNAKTGLLTALSVVALLKKIKSPLRVGT